MIAGVYVRKSTTQDGVADDQKSCTIVEHVTVAAGGQAIVGAAVMPGGGTAGPNGR